MTKYVVYLSLLIAALCFTGCSGNRKVSGKVVYEDDKSPLTSGIVSFETETFRAKGGIKPDGTYVMGSEKEADGLPPGKYKVTIVAYTKPENSRGIPMPAVAEEYASMATTPLEVEVTKSMVYDIEVKRP